MASMQLQLPADRLERLNNKWVGRYRDLSQDCWVLRQWLLNSDFLLIVVKEITPVVLAVPYGDIAGGERLSFPSSYACLSQKLLNQYVSFLAHEGLAQYTPIRLYLSVFHQLRMEQV